MKRKEIETSLNYYLGIDFGTSGARAIVIDGERQIVSATKSYFQLSHSSAEDWQTTLYELIAQIPQLIRTKIKAIAINGTSGTVLLCGGGGKPLEQPILYNDDRARDLLPELKAIVPANHLVLSASSSFAKLYWWHRQSCFAQARHFLHQADWLAFLLHGKLGISDYHNALKLGYDAGQLKYPDWLIELPFSSILPKISAPGSPIAVVTPTICDRFGLPQQCLVRAGTTDSIAAFLASGASQPGEAVTSLGSTLVVKLLSTARVEDSRYGIYSHRLGNLWLTGGASNTGGGVLKHFFSDRQIAAYSTQIDPEVETDSDYYPLLQPGERFPLNDPCLAPKLEPQPEDPVKFLHGLLESMAKIEARGYRLLQQLGATQLSKVYTAGGGAKNEVWNRIRQRQLNVPVVKSTHTEAAYGTALLAATGDFND